MSRDPPHFKELCQGLEGNMFKVDVSAKNVRSVCLHMLLQRVGPTSLVVFRLMKFASSYSQRYFQG